MFQDYKHVHFVGIGGIGMSALAKWFLHEGVRVSGSDMVESEITKDLKKRGAQIFIGHDAMHVSHDVDLLIHSPAVPESNPERAQAKAMEVRDVTNVEFLGEISQHFSTIVVTGTNGKSTTTAMLGLILIEAGYDPTVLVGSLVPGFADGNIRFGKSRFFVVEGCEYQAGMLQYHPEMIVLTNIEEDHLDYYRDIDHIKQTFQQFVDKLSHKGLVVVNNDDAVSRSLQMSSPVSYGTSTDVHYQSTSRECASGVQSVTVMRREGDNLESLGTLVLSIPGVFNVMNALASVSAAMEIGVPFETCVRALAQFKGIWRRFERVTTWNGAEIISDYAHHPTAIAQTIGAVREFFPGRRVVVCFQPHQHNRTRMLFDGFVESIALADVAVVCEIYDVAGRNEDAHVSAQALVDAMVAKGYIHVEFASTLEVAEKRLHEIIQLNDVVLIMGAGDVDTVARQMISLKL